MSHTVLLKALEFAVVGRSRKYQVFAFLTAQRQLFNSLAPILPSVESLIPLHSEPFFRLLMRADTFRFATSLCVAFGMNAALAQEILGKMDFVVEVEISSNNVGDELTPTLLALPHLERVVISHDENMTYNGTLRPLLKHPRESVRRSAAQTRLFEFNSFSTDQLIAVHRDDLIPLIDSASCNGAILDYLALAQYHSDQWFELPKDIILALGERLFQFFTATNSHSQLINKALYLLGELASGSCRDSEADDEADVILVVDVFKEWPLLEYIPDMIRRGAVTASLAEALRSIISGAGFFVRAPSTTLRHHQQRFFDLHLPDLIYDSYFARTGKSPLSRELAICFMFSRFTLCNPAAFLRTNIVQKELWRYLIPWHREVMAEMLRVQRRGEPLFSWEGKLLIEFDRYDFYRRTAAAEFVLRDLLFPIVRRAESSEFLLVMRVLFDENELNIGPVLRSYLTFARDAAASHYRSREPDKYPCGDDIICSLFFVARDICVTERQRRRDRGDNDAGTVRSYFSEFLASLDPTLHCRLCGRSAFRAPTADT